MAKFDGNRVMRLYQSSFVLSVAIVLGLSSEANICLAQSPIWENYQVVDTIDAYTPLAGGNILPGYVGNTYVNFVNSTGDNDMNNGTADSIPTGFTFEYNGMIFNSVNININGWISANPIGSTNPNPSLKANNSSLFTPDLPNNVIAPYWGDHYYRTTEPGYTPSTISYNLYRERDPNPNTPPSSQLVTFTVEWRNLNVNDSTNPNSIASFQLLMYAHLDDTGANSSILKPTFEFLYGSADSSATIDSIGAVVGAKDSSGLTHLNALFQTSEFSGDSTRLSLAKTTCWPPPSCTPGTAILLIPVSTPASVPNLSSLSASSIQNFPNPFSRSTTINISSQESGMADVSITNCLGSEVARLFEGDLEAGQHTFTWNAAGLPSETYWVRLKINGNVTQAPIVMQDSK